MSTSAPPTEYQFHPAVDQWFTARFKQATEPQARGWPAIQAGQHTLIAAPTGSGKTLAAFLACLDQLVRDQQAGDLPQETRVLYVSPLKALSNDINKNLDEPLSGIREVLAELGVEPGAITTAVRTGDTTPKQRRAIIKHPPHVLVTTPESFYLLLTSVSGRNVLKTVRTLIVDEIHALAPNRRGAHLSLSIERLDALTERPVQRIGLSATQKPMSLVADFLIGSRPNSAGCTIVDEGHLRAADLNLELPGSPLESVMSHEVWEEIYARLLDLIASHKTTLIFVNTRRMAERITYNLAAKLGDANVASHHGSLALDIRQNVEHRLKTGSLSALVATASLELGIDIGYVDLVCQIGSTRAIATFLQRVGRSGHYYGGLPKGRIFPLTRDELVEAAALLRAVRAGHLDKLIIPPQPMDVLAQQIVASCADEEWSMGQLYQCLSQAWPYRNMSREDFDSIVFMLADGFETKRGRRGAHLFYDGVNQRLKGRKGARLTALTNGGAIPDNADYRVQLEPHGRIIGSLNEDFAVESLPGDIFQLGNNSWRILKIETGTVRVEDAAGQPPTIPFWFGEAPARTPELSRAVSDLRADVNRILVEDSDEELLRFLSEDLQLPSSAAEQLSAYLTTAHIALGALPTHDKLIIERFFDEAGGMQMVVHAPFGARLNRAWGLSLRKRFCRSFNFELQAAATEDAIVLSLGPSHSFPLDDVFHYLNHRTVREILVQALLDAPMFQTHWRWNASRAFALLRQRGGKRVPPQFQRMQAEDLVAVVFPDQLACLENIAGDREVPDHPLVNQTIKDCLEEVMDVDALIQLLQDLESGAVTGSALDLPEPSVLAHEVLTANPYAFLDNAPLEERRTQAVYLRRALTPDNVLERGLLDEAAIGQVRQWARPEGDGPDEVHETLLLLGALNPNEPEASKTAWCSSFASLQKQGRAGLLTIDDSHSLLIAAERLPQWRAVFPQAVVTPDLTPPQRDLERQWEPEEARLDLLRARMEICGPVTAAVLAELFHFQVDHTETALTALEAEGTVLRGIFEGRHRRNSDEQLQWCNRRLLARIHQLTIGRLRAGVKPVSSAVFMRFLFRWQHVFAEFRTQQLGGLELIMDQLEGYEAAAGAWESGILAVRLKRYEPGLLDQLCLMGALTWARLNPPNTTAYKASGPLKTSPIGFYHPNNAAAWPPPSEERFELSTYAKKVLGVLDQRGALFFPRIQQEAGLLRTHTETAVGELTALGLIHSDSFAGLRVLLQPAQKKASLERRARGRYGSAVQVTAAGRWSRLGEDNVGDEDVASDPLEIKATALLRRYGVVFRRLLDNESDAPPWRDLLRIYRHKEAVGEIRGGYFVDGVGGEQFALPEAVATMRNCRKVEPDEALIRINGCDPLNLTAILSLGGVVSKKVGNQILFRDGLPVAAFVDGGFKRFGDTEETDFQLESLLAKTRPDRLRAGPRGVG